MIIEIGDVRTETKGRPGPGSDGGQFPNQKL